MPNFVDDYGVVFALDLVNELNQPRSISDATTLEMLFIPPSGVTKTKTATLSGTARLVYSTVAGDLDEEGTWQVRAHVVGPSYNLHSSLTSFQVLAQLP